MMLPAVLGITVAEMQDPAAEREAALLKVLAEIDRTDVEHLREGLLQELQAVIYQPQGLPALDRAVLMWLAEVLQVLSR